jgi:hypothetical protein
MAADQNPTVEAFNHVTQLLRAWDLAEDYYRKQIAEKDFTSGTAEDMMQIASRKRVRHYLTMFVSKIEDHMELEPEGRWGKMATAAKDEEKATEVLDGFKESLTREYMMWHKPNSTSNVHVEIELMGHEALREAVKALNGMNW